MVDIKVITEKVREVIEDSKQRNFMESVDLTFNLKDVDMSTPKNRIDEEITLPRGRGKTIRIAVIGSAEMAEKARDKADLFIKPEEMDDLADDRKHLKKIANSHRFFIAEAPLMPTIGKKFGIVLGPRGKMPRPIPPGADPSGIIEALRNTVKIRSRDKITFHTPVGTKDMTPEDIAANIDAVIKRVDAKLERGALNIRSIYVSTTMGISRRIM